LLAVPRAFCFATKNALAFPSISAQNKAMSSSTDHVRKNATFLMRHALQSLGVVVILALLIRTFLIGSFVMTGSSMLPNIWPGDFLLALRVLPAPLQRGDVVVLRCPSHRNDPSANTTCLRRVIGLPGDRIEFHKGILLINGKTAGLKSIDTRADVLIESINNEKWAVWPPADSELKGFPKEPTVVPPGYYYVLNDKRSDLEDSRRWGPLARQEVEGRVWLSWLSLEWYDTAGDVRTWPQIRWSRLFRTIN